MGGGFLRISGLALGLLLGVAGTLSAAEVNLYSARHYDSDQQIYDAFTKATGIEVNVIEGGDAELLERVKAEGRNSPADVLITVDAGRLWRAEEAGILQPVKNEVLEKAIPAQYRDPNGRWFGVSTRARVIVYAKDRVKPSDLSTYEDLADPKWKKRLLVRSSNSVYNQSLVGSLLAANGAAATESWARAIVANLARPPQGGDLDQLAALEAGEGDVAISNTYYFARLLASPKPEERARAQKLAVFFPNQQGRGTHVNISGVGVALNAPNRASAIRFLEFLVSPQAQKIFADANFEYPVVAGVAPSPIIADWGPFRADPLNASIYGKNNAEALKIMDRAGWR